MSGEGKKPNRRSAETTRRRILKAACELFSSNGYHGTATADLIEYVGLGKGGLYHHFKRKEDLLLEIMMEPINEVLASSALVVDSSESDPHEALLHLGRDLGLSMDRSLDAWTILLREYSALETEGRLLILDLRQDYLDRWRTVLQRGMEQGVFVDRSLAFVDSILGYFIYAFIWNRGADPVALTDNLMSVLTEGVAAPTQTIEDAKRS
ncbi:TetR/AcrR family transcriptional regulator [Ornithinimicrobium sp. Y1694]|uniref:TetR/AcrR family transcriptional regulator n=1 Tax=Ornithinimicrobium sp. Y1694 TaxID=3418590 RepID=UPI003CE7111E